MLANREGLQAIHSQSRTQNGGAAACQHDEDFSFIPSNVLRSLHFPEYQAMVQLLVQERLSAALTQRDLAERLKKPRSYVSKIEVCERRIDVMELIHYLRALKKIR